MTDLEAQRVIAMKVVDWLSGHVPTDQFVSDYWRTRRELLNTNWSAFDGPFGEADFSGTVPTGETRHVVDGRVVGDFAALAIVQYEADTGVYLFYCDAEWNAITDTHHDDIEGAVAQAEFEFGPLKFIDVSGT